MQAAPLTNIGLAVDTVRRCLERAPGLPGIGALYGRSGLGKTVAAAFCANHFKGVYIRLKSFSTAKAILVEVARELQLRPERTAHALFAQVSAELSIAPRLLIMDELDNVVHRGALNVLRDIHDETRVPLLVIGEERLPQHLEESERFHNRVLVWQPAQRATLADAEQLVKFYGADLHLTPAQIELLHGQAQGIARRLVVLIEHLRANRGEQPVEELLSVGELRAAGHAPLRRMA